MTQITNIRLFICLCLGAISLLGCDNTKAPAPKPTSKAVEAPTEPKVSVADAEKFVAETEAELVKIMDETNRAAWVQANFITIDTEKLYAKASARLSAKLVEFANATKQFQDLELPYDIDRKIKMIKLGMTLPAPSDSEKTEELAEIESSLSSIYGAGKYCQGGECKTLGELSKVIDSSRDPQALLEAWKGWRTVSPAMRSKYQRMVELANEGAKELGFADTGVLWRSKYDMPAEQFGPELDRLWGQVKPLYDSLHCHVRAKLNEEYGDLVDVKEPIPAHLLGNMWAQAWSNIYDMVKPESADPGFDLTERLNAKKIGPIEMVRYAENFFVSLGFKPLPDSFWKRSLFVKPKDREVQCHASAWNIDDVDDLRIKMCIKVDAEDFVTIHHELGHSFYQRAYNQKSIFYRNSANDGFHEAIGDTVALSMTPEYLYNLNLIDSIPDSSKDLGLLLKMALDKVAFLPFGLMIDKWRWQVFNGEIAPENYNAGWWELREKYQGIQAPVERTENDFDPGAKYHIPGNTPYSRYFLAHILQFQFHRDLCKLAGYEGPLHRCSIYQNEVAGAKLKEMLEMGSSRPWQEALEKISGTREMDASAILDYFAPLKTWLDEQNKNRQCGWGDNMPIVAPVTPPAVQTKTAAPEEVAAQASENDASTDENVESEEAVEDDGSASEQAEEVPVEDDAATSEEEAEDVPVEDDDNQEATATSAN